MKIEWVDLASQDYNVKASTMLAGGDTTDLYCVKELSDMQNWAKEGLIVPMTEQIAADGVDMTKYAGMDSCYVALTDGQQYALPFRADYWVMFYNKAALLPTAIALEWPIGEGVKEIKSIVNEEHSLIMTRELTIDDHRSAQDDSGGSAPLHSGVFCGLQPDYGRVAVLAAAGDGRVPVPAALLHRRHCHDGHEGLICLLLN